MRNTLMLVVGFVAALALVALADRANAVWDSGLDRPPIPVTGAAEEITCTAGASDSSAELDVPTAYMISCKQRAYIRWGTTAPTAAPGDFELPANGVLYFSTGGSSDPVRYVAARNVSVDGSCLLLEVR